MTVKFAPAVIARIVVAFAMISLAVSCSDDDSGSNPGGGRGVVELGSQDYSSISLELVGFPGGSTPPRSRFPKTWMFSPMAQRGDEAGSIQVDCRKQSAGPSGPWLDRPRGWTS